MSQKVSLVMEETAGNGETELASPPLSGDQLEALGLERNVDHINILFDNEKAARFSAWTAVIGLLGLSVLVVFSFGAGFVSLLLSEAGIAIICCSLLISCVMPVAAYPCLLGAMRTWAYSRTAAVTDKQLVLMQGRYSCYCCCWSQSTKSVPLEKITDLSVQQSCLQRQFNIRAICVETASSRGRPELSLIGLKDPIAARKKILKVRDTHELFSKPSTGTAKGDAAYKAPPVNGMPMAQPNPLLPAQEAASTEKLQSLVAAQHDTMIEVRDVLQEMRAALISMDRKMNQ